jgi:recombinational DNA repair ATPase RecF
LEAAFDPHINVIYGENAQGKTNLLEAVAYLSAAASHRARYDRELIQFGVDLAFIKALQTGDRGLIRSDYEDALKSLKICFAANRSMETGEVIYF